MKFVRSEMEARLVEVEGALLELNDEARMLRNALRPRVARSRHKSVWVTVIEANPGLTGIELANLRGVSDGNAYSALSLLVDRGVIGAQGNPKRFYVKAPPTTGDER